MEEFEVDKAYESGIETTQSEALISKLHKHRDSHGSSHSLLGACTAVQLQQ